MLGKILRFPFRVLGFVLRAILTPWYLRLFFRLPWWILLAVALFLTSLAYGEATRILANRVQFEHAIAQAPPVQVPLASFDARRNASAFGEVRITGTLRPGAKVRPWSASGPDHAYLPLFVGESAQVGAVVLVLKIETDKLENWIAANAVSGRVSLGGALKTSSSKRRGITAALQRQGYQVGADVPFIKPFLKGRRAGLESSMGTSAIFGVLLGGAALICAALALFKFVNWRRRGVRRPVPAKPLRPAPASPPTKTPTSGPWGGPKADPPPTPVSRANPPPPSPDPVPTPKLDPMLAQHRRPFVPRTPKQLVEEAFGPDPGRRKRD